MIQTKVAIIGGGHIGQAIAWGLLRSKVLSPMNLCIANPHVEKLEALKKIGVKVTSDNKLAVKKADIVIIAVRPRVVKDVAQEIQQYISKEAIIISLAAGISIHLLEKYLGEKRKIVRLMTNIPIAYGKGVLGWVKNRKLLLSDKKIIDQMFQKLGLAIECKNEDDLDKLSMIYGCGVGYVAYFMENLIKKVQGYGFSPKVAYDVVYQTFAGTMLHIDQTKILPKDLIRAVATKGGITEEVINSLEEHGFYDTLAKSIDRGYDKMKRIEDLL